jgi:hypothetical protein
MPANGRAGVVLSFGMPIATDLNGDQVEPDYRIISGAGRELLVMRPDLAGRGGVPQIAGGQRAGTGGGTAEPLVTGS